MKALVALLAVLAPLAGAPAKAATLSDQVHEVLLVGFLTFQDYRAGILGDLTRSAAKGDTSDLKLSLDELGRAAFIGELTEAIQ